MNLNIVLPSSREDWVAGRQEAYASLARPGTVVTAVPLDARVPLEADPADPYVLPEILDRICRCEADGADAIVIDCMDDPGVEEARRLVRIPVIGPGQAALHLAGLLGYRFSILYPLEQTRFIENVVERSGLRDSMVSVRIIDCGLDGFDDRGVALESLLAAARAAIREDGAHVIVPACTLTSGLTADLALALQNEGAGVPVIDGPAAAVQLAETLVTMALSHSRASYPQPLGVSERIA